MFVVAQIGSITTFTTSERSHVQITALNMRPLRGREYKFVHPFILQTDDLSEVALKGSCVAPSGLGRDRHILFYPGRWPGLRSVAPSG